MKLSQGAEAVLEREGDVVSKIRLAKTYRHPIIDHKLRQFRTRREAKVLSKLPVPGPKLISVDDKEMIIEMSFVAGEKVRDILSPALVTPLAKAIGKIVARLHNAEIVHGDLTTSNMLYHKKLYLVDFGLSFFSCKEEDKAVDLHVLKEALESTHAALWEKAWEGILASYAKECTTSAAVFERLEKVEQRGRHKHK